MNPSKDLKLLPHHFRKYAFSLLVATVLFSMLPLLKLVSIDKNIGFLIIKSGFLTAFLLLALTKEKMEDERTIRLRVLSFSGAFIMGVVSGITEPLINLLIDGSFISTRGTMELLISMFVFYFITYYILKYKNS